jgi:hypothetical protein
LAERPSLSRAREGVRRRFVTAAEEGAATALREQVDALSRRIAELEQRSAARHEELLAAMRAWERRQRRDVMTAMEKQAAATSAELVRERMPDVGLHVHPHDTLRHALRAVELDGMALEFGVASGTTLRIVVEHHRRGTVHGFDSFQGLPEHWRLGFDAGAFAQAEPPEVEGAELVVGWFDETLPGFLAEHPGPVAFLHLDADLYSSTATVLELVGPRLVPGSVLLFDEYLNYPGWQEHEHRAWTEHVERTGISWEYLGLTMDDEQVSVRITGVPPR